jgi:hypothetical protein
LFCKLIYFNRTKKNLPGLKFDPISVFAEIGADMDADGHANMPST